MFKSIPIRSNSRKVQTYLKCLACKMISRPKKVLWLPMNNTRNEYCHVSKIQSVLQLKKMFRPVQKLTKQVKRINSHKRG